MQSSAIDPLKLALLLILVGVAFAQTAEQREANNERQLKAFEPPTELFAWLREHAVPLETATPTDNNEDLLPLQEMIGEARVVALGEATHGTSEFFTIKHRIIQFLAEEMDFTIFSIEANMPEAYRLNEYVLTGEGNPRELLTGMYFWTWDTQEVLDMILWMREYNASGRGVMQFTGFDMQTPTVAMEEVRTFVETYDPAYLAQLARNYKAVESVFSQDEGWNAAEGELTRWRDAAQEVLTRLTDRKTAYSGANQGELAWAVQNARIVLQAAEYRLARFDKSVRGGFLRDKSMAANVEWILDQNSEAKVVLWAHNAHVKESNQWQKVMGEHLSEKFGDDYFSIGFAFYKGSFQARPRSGEAPQVHFANAAPIDSIESAFHTLGLPFFALDLREVRQDKRAVWLAKPQNARMIIGSIAFESQLSFSKMQLLPEYDAVIFVDQMTPTNLLR